MEWNLDFMTMLEIGFVGLTTIASYLGNIERFDGEFKRFASHLRIVPSVQNSAEMMNKSFLFGNFSELGCHIFDE